MSANFNVNLLRVLSVAVPLPFKNNFSTPWRSLSHKTGLCKNEIKRRIQV